MLRFFSLIAIGLAIAGCATHSKSEAPQQAPTIHRIAIIPAANPIWYTFENASPPVGYPFQFWVNKIDSHSKAYKFNAAVDPAHAAIGDALTSTVAKRLLEQGYEVHVLEDVVRPSNAPDSVDEAKADATIDADAIVHLWIDEVGMYSGHLSTHYIPRVNLGGKIWIKNHEDSLYSEVVYYGVDAKQGKSWAITPDARYKWDSFDQLMSSVDTVREAYASGTQAAAERLAGQILASIPHPAKRPVSTSTAAQN